MGKIAIKGNYDHAKEIIDFLKDIGGWVREGDVTASNTTLYYFLDQYGEITWGIPPSGHVLLPWDVVKQRYPFKLGDMVVDIQTSQEFRIERMRWDSEKETILYGGPFYRDLTKNKDYTSENLKYVEDKKQETIPIQVQGQPHMVENKVCSIQFNTQYCLDKVELNLGKDFELKEEDGKWFAVKKKREYPKTYQECCEVLGIDRGYLLNIYGLDLWKGQLLGDLQILFICRNAYWKIAGEEMGLDKPWKPDWTSTKYKYCIAVCKNKVESLFEMNVKFNFAFPTPEMRDAFRKNFDKDLETCKELL